MPVDPAAVPASEPQAAAADPAAPPRREPPEAEGAGAAERAVAGLVALLDLEPLEEDIFRGQSPDTARQRVFGGQVAGQALVAVGRTVPAERSVHSLHSYFLRPGDPSVPLIYTVERTRDGRSFSTRRVLAVQHGKTIFALTASFCGPDQGWDHSDAMPEVPGPAELPTMAQRLAGYPQLAALARPLNQPFELRYVEDPPMLAAASGRPREARSRVWLRAVSRLPDDPLLHVCIAAFFSDLTLLDTAALPHGVSFGTGTMTGASLDHAMWFHRPFRADEWLLYDQLSPSASGGRGFCAGRIFTADGRHAVTVAQEGLMRAVVPAG